MSLFSGQVAVSTTGTVVCQVSGGPGNVVITNAGTGVIYLGFGPGTPSATSGMPLPSGGVFSFQTFQGQPGQTLRAIASAGTSTAGFFVSSASQGLSQPGIF